ncbi:DUF4184 family protein [Oxalobacteraceae bacterium OM1]|nr:DUF4184 family protein [Oxalobacteraceae bacterium OM1]
MPFTLAHPAAILPLRRFRWLNFVALFIGSTAPDLAWIIPTGLTRDAAHSAVGAIVVALPIGIALYVVCQWLVKLPLCELLPSAVRTRLPGPSGKPPGVSAATVLSVVLSTAIGIATHIVWDWFTHEDSIAARHLAFLSAPIELGGGFPMPMFDVLQYASTVVGLAALGMAGVKWMRTTPVVYPKRVSVLTRNQRIVVVTAVASACLLGFVTGLFKEYAEDAELSIYRGAIRAIRYGGLATLVYCIAFHVRTRLLSRRSARIEERPTIGS